jgi:plasmid replication initiation protein
MEKIKILIERIADIRRRAEGQDTNGTEQLALFKNDRLDVSSEAELLRAELSVPLADGQKKFTKNNRGKLLPVRHLNREFFLCDLFDYALKDDGASMEAPIFTLTTKPDTSIWHWESKDGSRSVTVTPSVLGRATQLDKDILIYIISQMTEALNHKREDARKRTTRFTVHDYLVATNKLTGGKEYRRLESALERLRGTSIKTDIRTGGQRIKEGFGIIDSWMIIEKSPEDERMIAVEVTLSKWLYNAVQAHEVLTLHPDYFRLRKPLERRLYELARKHCGHQTLWTIHLKLLQNKAGSKGSLREFRRMVREIINADTLPDYRMKWDEHTDKVIFYIKDTHRLINAIAYR